MKQRLLVGFVAILLASVGIVSCDSASGPEKNYHVKYAIKMEGEGNQMAEAMKQMGIDLENTGMDMHVAGDKAQANMDLGMMKMKICADGNSKEVTMLMSAMGQNMGLNMKGEDFDAFVDHQNKDFMKPKITEETKEIAGYNCTKAIVANKDGQEMEIWFTKDLFAGSDATGYSFGLAGMPLDMNVVQSGMKMHFVAKEVKVGKQADELFDMTLPEGTEELTLEDLQKM